MRRLVGAVALALLVCAPFADLRGTAQDTNYVLLPGRERLDPVICGTDRIRARELRLRPARIAANGEAMSFLQDPPILSPEFLGTITLRNFLVAGDVQSVRFQPSAEGSAVETWARTGTREVAGRLISEFNPSWDARMMDQVLRGHRFGWDAPVIYWGEALSEGDAPARGIWLRIAPTSVPAAQVRRIADDTQYSSHVVNMVVPGFGQNFLNDDDGFEETQVTAKFYQHFEDTYDSIAIVPEESFLADYRGYHRHVKNEVQGIGLGLFDRSARYGSLSGRLQSVEMFHNERAATNDTSAHEFAHQWGSYIDWTRLTGITRTGHQPSSHDPLWAEGETVIGSVLRPYRRVRRGAASWEIERTPAPVRFHPFTLYAMGLVPAEQVPEITLFDDQGQFGAEIAIPAPGTAVTGTARSATVFNVIGMLGPRSGPVPSTWQRATVVVSRDRLVSQREMDYWTFFAQRLEDHNRSGVMTYDGYGSIEVATSGRIDVKSDVRPLYDGPIDQRLATDFPELGRRDWRDVVFDAPVATRYAVGDRPRWTGVVSARDRSDISAISIRLWKSGGTADDSLRVQGSVSSRSSFDVQMPEFRPEHRGIFQMEVFLFWPGSGAQLSRVSISPITIN
jgi:hypothetical protein